jgi:hypothetical protein
LVVTTATAPIAVATGHRSVFIIIGDREKKVRLKILLAKRTDARFFLLLSTSKQSTFGGLISAKLA